MSSYLETPAIQGERPFRCYVCGKMLAVSIEGEYRVRLQCHRCKTKITLETVKPLPNGLVIKHGELVKL
jgi:hypothetical protein